MHNETKSLIDRVADFNESISHKKQRAARLKEELVSLEHAIRDLGSERDSLASALMERLDEDGYTHGDSP